MNLLEILKKIYSCTMPQAASEGLSIPSLIGYSKLLPMLRNSYKKQKV